MDLLSFALCWTPVILLCVLAILFRRPALDLSVWGAVFTAVLTWAAYGTPPEVILLAALDGLLTTLPLLLVIFAGILLSMLLTATGSLGRMVEWLSGGVRGAYERWLLIAMGVGNFMEGASVIAEPVVAPMLRVAGVAPMGAAALSIVGYAGLMTLEMAGIIVTVLSLVTGIPERELGVASAWLSVPATLAMAACIPVFLPRREGGAMRLPLALGCGLLAGLATLAAASYVGVSISGMLGGLTLILAMTLRGGGLRIRGEVLRDLAPFLLMLGCLLLVNVVPPLKELAFERLVFTVQVVPVHPIAIRPLFSAYVYLLAAFLLAAALLRVQRGQLGEVLLNGARRGWRASVAMGLFGAMGQIIALSGYDATFSRLEPLRNIPWVLAHGLEVYSGGFYPVFVPILGWVGTFLTGYGVASLMLFGPLQVEAAAILGASPTWLSAGLAVGASLGSISSPFKIAIATPMCGAMGKEGRILRLTIPMGIAASLLIGLILWVGLRL